MYYLIKTKNNIASIINESLGGDYIDSTDIVYPPNHEMGDLSLPCFKAAKALNVAPAEAAKKIMEPLKSDEVISGVSAAGPYLNIKLNKVVLSGSIISEIEKMKNDYGKNGSGEEKKEMIEYSNANTHKEYHVGHLRNLCFGDAVNRIIAANGFISIPVSYINDFGIHVAKTIWWTFNPDNERAKEFLAKEQGDNRGYFLGQMYSESTKKIEEIPGAKEAVQFTMKKIESKKGEEHELWKKTREWSIKQFNEIYTELDIKFDHIFYESEVIDKGRKIVEELIEKGILEKSQGAVIADLEKYGLGILVFLRDDGTALYPVADIPLAMEKFEKYGLKKSIYVVDVRQSLYFKQLFKVMELMGYKQEMVHLGFEFVKLPTGMMSSRTGNIIPYEELKYKMIEKATNETKTRHPEWDEDKISEVAKTIAVGAMKFEMIKVSAANIINFDIDQAMRFDGFTSAYLQYTYARINSIIRKSGVESQVSKVKTELLKEKKEHELLLKLAQFPEIVEQAGDNYDPSVIAKYLFELAQSFNDYYHKIPVLKAEEEIKNARLTLIKSVSQVIKNGLMLLGISTLNEM